MVSLFKFDAVDSNVDEWGLFLAADYHNLDLILPKLICSFHRKFSAVIERSITFRLLIGIIVRLENSFAGPSRLN